MKLIHSRAFHLVLYLAVFVAVFGVTYSTLGEQAVEAEEARQRREQAVAIGDIRLAIYADDVTALGAALEAGADPNETDQFGNTPIYSVISLWKETDNTLGLIEKLIRHGASVNHVNNSGATPLHWVAENEVGESESITRALIAAGADPGLSTHSPSGTAYEAALAEGNKAAASAMRMFPGHVEPDNKAELEAEGRISLLITEMVKTDDPEKRRVLAERIATMTFAGEATVTQSDRDDFVKQLLDFPDEGNEAECETCP